MIAEYILAQVDAFGGMQNMPELSHEGLPQIKALQWPLLVKMLQRQFFSRRWIIQEMCLAKLIVVLYGNAVISWKDLLLLSLKAQVLEKWFDLDRMTSVSTTMLPYMEDELQGLEKNGFFL